MQGSESQGSRVRGCGEPPRPASTDGVGECCPCKLFITGMYRKCRHETFPRAKPAWDQNPASVLPQDDLESHMKPWQRFSASGLDVGRENFKGRRVFVLAEDNKALADRLKWVLEGWRQGSIAQGIFPGV